MIPFRDGQQTGAIEYDDDHGLSGSYLKVMHQSAHEAGRAPINRLNQGTSSRKPSQRYMKFDHR